MRKVFADALYWIAIVKPNDPYREQAQKAQQETGLALKITTDEVLAELLTSLANGGPVLRRIAVQMVRAIMENPNVRVIPQSRASFLNGVDRYSKRADKEYSLADCVSMNVMEMEGVTEVLSNDHHFEQEGFRTLITKK